jgi:uncharacterized protein YdeI (YjbR/CyaY-like superfamily)
VSGYEEAPWLAPRSRAEWRRWLEENHASSTGVWLLIAKKSAGTQGVSYDDAVEEALCFGWIDSRVRGLDELRFRQWYCPRRQGSIWSQPNKERVRRLLETGLMAPPGLARVETAQADGSWEMLDRVEALEIPADLEAALTATTGAAQGFSAMAPSLQKQYLYWVLSAKRPQTRAKRIAAVAQAAAEGRSSGPRV